MTYFCSFGPKFTLERLKIKKAENILAESQVITGISDG